MSGLPPQRHTNRSLRRLQKVQDSSEVVSVGSKQDVPQLRDREFHKTGGLHCSQRLRQAGSSVLEEKKKKDRTGVAQTWGGGDAESVFVPLLRRRRFSCDDLTPSPLPLTLAGCFFTAAATSEFVSMEAGEVARGGRARRRRGAILLVAKHCCKVEESFCSRKCLVSLSHTRVLAVPVCDSQGPYTPGANLLGENGYFFCSCVEFSKAKRQTLDL